MSYKYYYFMTCVCAFCMILGAVSTNVAAACGWFCAMLANLTIAKLKKYFDK